MIKTCLLTLFLILSVDVLHAAPPAWHRYKITGDHFLKNGKPLLAVHEYRKALDLNPGSPEVYFNLAIACYESLDLGGAATALESLTILVPTDTEAFYNLGCLSLYDGKMAKARTYFKKAQVVSEKDSPFLPLIARGLEFTQELLQCPSQGLMLYLLNHGLLALPFQESDNGLGA